MRSESSLLSEKARKDALIASGRRSVEVIHFEERGRKNPLPAFVIISQAQLDAQVAFLDAAKAEFLSIPKAKADSNLGMYKWEAKKIKSCLSATSTANCNPYNHIHYGSPLAGEVVRLSSEEREAAKAAADKAKAEKEAAKEAATKRLLTFSAKLMAGKQLSASEQKELAAIQASFSA